METKLENTRQTKARLFLMLVGLFLLLFLPLGFFHDQIDRLYENEKEIARTDLKDRLLQEISDFQLHLKPETMIQTVFDRFQNEINSGQVDIFSSIETGKAFARIDCKKFNYQVHQYFQKCLKLKPLFVAVTPDDLSEHHLVASPKLKTGGLNQNELGMFLLDIGLARSKMKILKERSDLHQELYALSQQIFSTFNNEFISPGLVTRVFSDLYGFQHLFLYHHKLEFNGRNFGYFSAGFLESDFDLSAWENFAENLAGSGMMRRILPADNWQYKKHGFFQNEDKLGFIDTISADYASVLRLHFAGNIEQGGFDKILLVEARLSLNSYLQTLSLLLRWAKKLLFLLFFCFSLYVSLFGFYLCLNLRRKFILIAAAVLLPPALLLSIFLILNQERINSEIFSKAKTGLQEKVRQAELLIYEAKDRQSIAALVLKERLLKLSPQDFNSHSLSRQARYADRNSFMNGIFYTATGKVLIMNFNDEVIFREPNILIVNNCIKYLNNLIGLDTGNRTIQKQLERLELTNAFIGDFVQLFEDIPAIVAEEVVNMPDITKASLLSNMNFIIIPDLSLRPIMPWAVAYIFPYRFYPFTKLFDAAYELPASLAYEREGNVEFFINYAIRNSGRLESIARVNRFRNWPEMSGIFNSAIDNGSSGSTTIDRGDESEIHMWSFIKSSPFIIGGVCRLKKAGGKTLLNLLPVFSIAFVLLSLLVLSEIMGQLFLPPVRALQFCAENISKTANLNLGLEIQSNDEFKIMGQSFNQMVEGLQEKQHMSRFVSGRLLDRLDKLSAGQTFAEHAQVSMLFTDIRNFTAITEKNRAEEIVDMLNQYFTEMEMAIVANHGVIDRFIGDAIVAVFYADNCPDGPETAACRASLALRKKLADFNDQRQKSGEFTIETGIGIASGTVISGSIGKSGGRLEYSVIGPTFSRAAELESHCKSALLSKILVDENTFNKAADNFSFQQSVEFAKEYHLLERVKNA